VNRSIRYGHDSSAQTPCFETDLMPSRSIAPLSHMTVRSMTRSL
jgi:hypothetical protein